MAAPIETTPSSTGIPAYKTAFLQSCMSANILSFGTFTLKSGRQSPYFFNAGSFHSSSLLSALSTAYAHTIIAFLDANPEITRPDVVFGPAYKGIPLACTTLLSLHTLDPKSWSHVSYSFNRKEIKDHGEGGAIVGASLRGKNVLVIDDVITAGTAMRETLKLVDAEGGRVVGFVVALDRMEKMPRPPSTPPSAKPVATKDGGEGEGKADGGGDGGDDDGEPRMSAMGQIRKEFGVRTASVVTLEDLIVLLREKGLEGDMARLEAYRNRYKASD